MERLFAEFYGKSINTLVEELVESEPSVREGDWFESDGHYVYQDNGNLILFVKLVRKYEDDNNFQWSQGWGYKELSLDMRLLKVIA